MLRLDEKAPLRFSVTPPGCSLPRRTMTKRLGYQQDRLSRKSRKVKGLGIHRLQSTADTLIRLYLGRFTQMYYSPLFKDYLGGTRIPCDSNVLAFTGPPHLRSITLCPLMFSNTNSQSKSMLEPYRAPNGLPPNQPLQEYMSWSGTFLHEMTHLLRPGSKYCRLGEKHLKSS